VSVYEFNNDLLNGSTLALALLVGLLIGVSVAAK
jgi:hypothetical protein